MNQAPKSFLGLISGLVVGGILGFWVGNDRIPVNGDRPDAGSEVPPAAPSLAPLSEVPPELQGKLSLFILAGQSNMSGRGEMLPIGKQLHPKIFLFGNDYRWRLASEPVDNAFEQVDSVSEDKAAGFSPGMAFARGLLQRGYPNAIALVPCAKAGTPIAEWQRSPSDRTLYGSCLKRARAASVMGEIAGILFFQGEADGKDPQSNPAIVRSPDTWGEKFTAFVNDFRGDLERPDLPIVFAEISADSSAQPNPYRERVKAQQRNLQLPYTATFSTDDLPRQPDDHFTAKSYQIIGDRFAEAFWNLTQAP